MRVDERKESPLWLKVQVDFGTCLPECGKKLPVTAAITNVNERRIVKQKI